MWQGAERHVSQVQLTLCQSYTSSSPSQRDIDTRYACLVKVWDSSSRSNRSALHVSYCRVDQGSWCLTLAWAANHEPAALDMLTVPMSRLIPILRCNSTPIGICFTPFKLDLAVTDSDLPQHLAKEEGLTADGLLRLVKQHQVRG